MEPFRHRVVIIVFAFLFFAAIFFVSRNPSVYRFLFNRSFSSNQVSVTGGMLIERLEVFFPGLIRELSKLNPQQQKQFIERVRCDIVTAASANGKSIEQACQLGEIVAMVLSRAISRGTVSDAYF
ncbi:hypothetical protein BHOIPH791_11780 [Bartonella henselae]|uniref:Uncharacterized protein n=1 Tax=Bartonella henselae (strain ATCC 49882 / DSM 28221 / CCUG 30454 / Houston 1) TaxID=283166 RepID=A0A0H3M3S4_BARHE|nr:hypothetical protein [Bartonella henselae]ATP12624.1 hypothetical protein BhenCHDE101_05775 [Bartonella henselae]ETS08241.1 hypothetical protein Q654_01113 [Bartonella henselae JK 50]ETS08789.1 hypothetical protein Q655_01066 [Bartonella henselae JK 51]MDM9990391.1 hypothetical protein [Bartonella henselae]OLL38505.1 hypothetical protein AT237_01970 [Bartonella henselae]